MPIRYLSGLSVDSTVLVVDAANDRVGIGTASPGVKLQVTGGSADTSGQVIIGGTATDYTSGIDFYTSTTGRGFVGWRGPSSAAPYNAYGMYLVNYDNSPIIFGTSTGSEKMRINDNGNVGIGTTAPSAKLHVNPATVNEIAIAINGTQNYSANSFQRISAGDASSLNRVAIGFGYNSTPEWTIRYSSYHNHEFFTGNDWGSSTEKMRITSAGNVGIGTTSPGIGDGTYVAPLTISSASTLGTFLAIKNTQDSLGMGGVWMQANTGNAGWLFGTDNDGKGVLHYGSGASETNALTDAKDGTKGITIDTSGNVGIGTAAPSAELQVNKASDVTIAMSNSTAVTSGNRGNLAFYNSAVSTVALIKATAVTDNVGTQLEFYTRPAAGSLTQVLTLASTGAATFSSSVTAVNGIFNQQKVGSGVESLDALSLRLFGTNAIGDSLNVKFINVNGTQVASISGLLGPDNIAYGSLAFSTRNFNTDSMIEVMRIDNRARVGIGTTTPSAPLTVAGGTHLAWTAATSRLTIDRSGTVARIQNYDNGSVANVSLQWEGGNVGIGTTAPYSTLTVGITDATAEISSGGPNTHLTLKTVGASGAIRFFTIGGTTSNLATTESMRIAAGGNVGIGTTSPDATGFGWRVLTIKGGASAGEAGVLELQSGTSDTNNQNLGIIAFLDGSNRNAQIGAKRATSTSTSYLDFYTNAGAGLVERMRITSDGSLLVGATNPDIGGSVKGTIIRQDGSIVAARNIASPFHYQTPISADRMNTMGDGIMYSMWREGVFQAGIGATNTSNMTFFTGDNTSASERMRITAAGNVGIGTTNPEGMLTIGTTNPTINLGDTGVSVTDALIGRAAANDYHVTGSAAGDLTIRPEATKKIVFGTTSTAATTGVARMTIDTSGNVGIGTTNPLNLLHVSQASANTIFRLGNNASYDQFIYFNGGNDWSLGMDYSNSNAFVLSNSSSIGTNDRVVVTTAGNVGIGTTAPKQKLIVEGVLATKPSGVDAYYSYLRSNWAENNAFELGISDDGDTTFHKLITSSNYYFGSTLQFWTSDTEKMRITSGGNVGIGTTSPAYKLDVSSDIRIGEGLRMSPNAGSLYAVDGALSYYSSTNGVYLNGAGTNGWLRLNGSGVENDSNSINIYGAGAGGYIELRTGTSTRILIQNGGNVGIGTTSPAQKLDVEGSVRATGGGFEPSTSAWINAAFTTKINGSPYGGGLALIDGTTGWAQYTIGSGANLVFAYGATSGATSEKMRITSAGNVGIGTTGPSQKLEVVGKIRLTDDIQLWSANPTILWESGALRFYNNSTATERMRITSDGNVGIGTTGPTEKLHVDGSTLITYNNSFQSTNSVGNKAILARVSPTSGIVNYAEYATATNLNGFVIGSDDARVKGNIATDSLEFITNTSTRMTILSSGNVGINTTTPGSTLHVIGDVLIQTGALGVGVNPNATDGRIDASNDIVAFSTSDRRLKENITPIANALEKVRSLTGVEFDWKEETKSVHGYEGHDVGVIAQDVQAVLPEAVRTNDSGYLSVRYEKMIALLVEAMKEQQAQIDELKKLIK